MSLSTNSAVNTLIWVIIIVILIVVLIWVLRFLLGAFMTAPMGNLQTYITATLEPIKNLKVI